jgi:cyanophycin synthetase
VPADAATIVELRVLEGPNLYFARPAIKLTLAVPGWMRAGEAAVAKAAAAVGVSGTPDPGAPGTDQRRRTVARIAAAYTRSIALAAGARRLGVKGRAGDVPDRVVVAFPWRRRGSAEALARATGRAMAAGARRAPARVIGELAPRVRAADPGLEPTVPDPTTTVVQVTGTNGKTTTTRLLAHLVASSGRSVAYSSTDGVYRGTRRVKVGDYSGFGGAATALAQHPDVAVLETARGGILLRGIGVLHNDVAVVTNVSADHLDLHGVHTVDQLAEVKGTVVRITRPDGWDVLNADDPRVLAMRRYAAGRPWITSLDHDHPAIREVLAEGGRATTVIDGAIAVLDGHDVDRLVPLLDVPSTLAGLSSVYTANALAAASAGLAAGLPRRAVVGGLRSFVLDPERNPGRANLFTLRGRVVVLDYAHNEAGIAGLVEILNGLAVTGGQTWLAICTAGDRTPEILHGFAFRAAVGVDHLAIADLRRYTRGRTTEEIYAELSAAAAEAGVHDVPRYRGELQALRAMLADSRPRDVVAVTALGMRPQLFRWLGQEGARRLTPGGVRRLARRSVGGPPPTASG